MTYCVPAHAPAVGSQNPFPEDDKQHTSVPVQLGTPGHASERGVLVVDVAEHVPLFEHCITLNGSFRMVQAVQLVPLWQGAALLVHT